MNTTILFVSELDCPAEEKLIRSALTKLPQIKQMQFNFITQEITFVHQFNDAEPIINALKTIGITATIKQDKSSAPIITVAKLYWWMLSIAGFFAISAEVISIITKQEQSWYVIILAFLAIALSGKETLLKGLSALRTFTLNINFLMITAIIGASLIGEWPEAAMVTVLFALAETIEKYSLEKARQAIHSLMVMTPDMALVKTENNKWQSQRVMDIQLNAVIWVKPGERIPLDGIITRGQSSVNQASITGESMPIEKIVGDSVYAGTINERGSFEFKVTAHPGDTLLAKIIRAVQQAQTERAPTQRFVDQFAKCYTPLMVIFAISIAIVPPLVLGMPVYPWLNKALVLLVIACPCALVISTPVTIVSGLAAAAKHGILVKGGVYLEQGHKLKVIVFDKTGTLTEGKPIVTKVILLVQQDDIRLLQIATSLDIHSEHPVATAIVTEWYRLYNDTPLLAVSMFEAITGRGATGIIDGERYYVGNHQLAEDNQICTAEIETLLAELEQAGQTTIIVSTQTKALAVLAIADTPRNSSRDAIQALHDLNIKTIMMTGDNKLTAQSIAKQMGIDEVQANLLPIDKLTALNELLDHQQYVGMIGDGMNDAPALAKATIGFAMGKGTETAIETADITLMDNNLLKVPFFIRLSKRTAHVLTQNISFSISIKGIFFILALLGFSTLWMAVFADMGASLIVVANGLSLIKFK